LVGVQNFRDGLGHYICVGLLGGRQFLWVLMDAIFGSWIIYPFTGGITYLEMCSPKNG